MADIVIYETTGAPSRVSIFFNATPDGSNPPNYSVTAITLRVGQGGGAANATLHLSKPFDLSATFVESGGGPRLKTKTELEQTFAALKQDVDNAANAAERELKTRLVEALREAKARLREALRSRTVALGGAGQSFFGAEGVDFGAGAAFTASVTINLAALLPEDDEAAEDTILDAQATGKGTLKLTVSSGSLDVDVAMRLQVRVDRSDVKFRPFIELPAIPKLPTFNLSFPELSFPSLNLDLTLPTLDNVLRIEAPLPKLPVGITWQQGREPVIQATLVAGKLDIITTAPGAGTVQYGNQPVADLDNFKIALRGGQLTLEGKLTAATDKTVTFPSRSIDAPWLPFTIDVAAATFKSTVSGSIEFGKAGNFSLKTELTLPRVVIVAKEDPSLFIALTATYTAGFDDGTNGRLTKLAVIEPYPLEFVTAVGKDVIDGIVRLLGMISLPHPQLPSVPDPGPLLRHLGKFLAAVIKWLARQAGAAARALLGIAEAALDLVSKILDVLQQSGSPSLPRIAIEVRLDAHTYALRQVWIMPARLRSVVPSGPSTVRFLGFTLKLPGEWLPALVIDLSARPLAALVVQPDIGETELATDLWLKRDGAGTEAIRDTDKSGVRADEPLITVRLTKKKADLLALVAFDDGQVSFFRGFVNPSRTEKIVIGPDTYTLAFVTERPVLRDFDINDVGIIVSANTTRAERLLPFFSSPKPSDDTGSGSFFDKLGQYVKIKKVDPPTSVPVDGNGEAVLPLQVELTVGDLKADTMLELRFNVRTLSARIAGGTTFKILGPAGQKNILGLTAELMPAPGAPVVNGEFEQFALDFTGGDVRLALSDQARLDLSYRRIASQGKGLVFKVKGFAVTKGGIDLDAEVDPDEPVMLAGLDMPFRFSRGALSIKRGEIQAFSIAGRGQLPPALVGEGAANIKIAFGRGPGGQLVVQSADAELDKSNDPLVCHGTRFTITISKLGLSFRDFGAEGGTHFFFLLTGSAEFTPRGNEFGGGMLKYLPQVKIVLDKAPLVGDGRMLARAIEFQTALNPKRRVNFFELFEFELRGVGFHPAVQMFGDKPAMSISGQVNFLQAGDIVSPKFDFHKLWIAPPKSHSSLPQIRCDGLTVGLSIGSAATVEGTAIAVDDELPSIYKPDVLPADVTARGFLASGRLSIKGWPSMAAAMGFLELQRSEQRPRHAFFLYGQAETLAEPIPTPFGTIYLREAGFGFGFRYTLAGLAEADKVQTPNQLVQVLDELSKYQGELANVRAWQPEPEGDRVTLAMRAMFSVACTSQRGELSPSEEKLPNPVLFDAVIALRSDLTFMMNVRAWIAVNYWTWHKSGPTASFRNQPGLRGYLYISVPRQEILARAVSDRNGYIGNTPKLPEPLIKAMKAVTWSSTLYIRPGLYHHEFGWPYELGFDLDEGANFKISCRGGMVQRIEEGALLYGIAFKAVGFARFGGTVGGRSFGASVTARADFSIDAKLIAYLSLKRFNDTLFYGALAFSVTVNFGVRVWLEISLGFDDIHLEISFSIRLTITLALEVAVSPEALAGRGTATVSISGFGRSLGIGASFGFNEGRLAEARARVEHFLSLGLGAAVPDPQKGLEPPRPAQAPAKAAEQASEEIAKQAEKQELLQPEVPDIEGAAIGRPHFWALLFECTGQPGSYILTLIPRDHTDIGEDPGDKGKSKRKSRDFAVLAGDDSTFFVQPPNEISITPIIDYKIVDLPQGVLFKSLAEKDKEGVIAWERIVAKPDVGRGLPLGKLIESCFIRNIKDGKPGALSQPKRRAIKKREKLPEDRDVAECALTNAALDQIGGGPLERVTRDVEERRAAVIAGICESAAALASVADPEKQKKTGSALDVRDFGLTYLVREADIEKLFRSDGEATPPESNFMIKSRQSKSDDVDQDPGRRVFLFNPPCKFFKRASPRLAGVTIKLDGGSFALNWDLEPAWGNSNGVWHDPEFHLRHYRIERVVTTEQGVVTAFEPLVVTTKPAAPEKLHLEGGELVRVPLGYKAQFADDLADLPPAVRDAFLGRGDDPRKAWKEALDKFDLRGRRIKLQYTVVPVDCAGSEGRPTPLELELIAPQWKQAPLLKAELVIEYPGIPTSTQKRQPTLWLRVDDVFSRVEDKEHPQRLPGEKSRYILKIRRERTLASGIYGADALTLARQRPGAAEFARDETEDQVFEVVLLNRSDVLRNDPRRSYTEFDRFVALPIVHAEPSAPTNPDIGTACFKMTSGTLGDLLKALHIAQSDGTEVKASRIAVRRTHFEPPPEPAAKGASRQSKKIKKQPKAEAAAQSVLSPWCPADLVLRVLPPQNAPVGRYDRVETAVEVFEPPIDLSYDALHFDDLDGEAGRLLLYYPDPDKSLGNLVKPDVDPRHPLESRGIKRLRDGERRIGTRIRWNSAPVAVGMTAELKAKDFQASDAIQDPSTAKACIGGFDLFEIDLSALPEPDKAAAHAIRVGRVQTLPKLLRGIDPAQIEDFQAVESLYPSDTARLLAPGKAPDSSGQRRRSWFSPAESLLAWPELPLRRSVGLTPEQAELTALFKDGNPERIHVELSPWPAKLQPPTLVRVHSDGSLETQPDNGFSLPDNKRWTPATLTKLLRELIWQHSDSTSIDEAYRNDPSSFDGVRLRFTGTRRRAGSRVPTGAAELLIEFDPPMHPFLADVVDSLRWHTAKNGDGIDYRRYEPVLETPPPTKAKTIRAFMDERPEERDPYGWATLRTLGLAVGLKLFDLEQGDYVGPEHTLELVCAAVASVRRRYAWLNLGAPFVDVITRPDGLMSLASFDGGTPDVTARDVTDLLANETLSLVQVALRPIPQAFEDRYVTHYFRVDSERTHVKFELNKTKPAPNTGMLVEVIDISHGLAGGKPVALAHAEDRVARYILGYPNVKSDTLVIGEPDPKRAPSVSAATADAAVLKQFALVRLTTVGIAKPKDELETVLGFSVTEILLPLAAKAGIPPAVPEPFERFAALEGRCLDALTFGVAKDQYQDQDGKQLKDIEVAADCQASLSFERFRVYAKRRFPEDWPEQQLDERRAFLDRLAVFTRRFLVHGAARQPEPETVPFSLSTITRPDPWRVAPQVDGSMEVLLLHKDRFARCRRYVVRPFGRYENIAAAANKDSSRFETPSLIDIADVAGAADRSFAGRSVDVVVPRTHPLDPPLILSAARLDIPLDVQGRPVTGDDIILGSQRRMGSALEVVLANHPEEIISEANIEVADGLEFEHVGVTFLREFSVPAWTRALESVLGAPTYGLDPGFGDANKLPRPRPLSFQSSKEFGKDVEDIEAPNPGILRPGLPSRILDGWRGITSFRAFDVPYFYRLHAVAYAAAGVVVSKPSAAIIAEGRYSLAWPWPPPVPPPHSPQSWLAPVQPTPKATWRLDGAHVDDLRLRVHLPLVRLVDGLNEAERERWLAGGIPELFRIADPAVSYALVLRSEQADGANAVEIELTALPPALNADPRPATYAATSPGTRFAAEPRLQPSYDENYWSLAVAATPRAALDLFSIPIVPPHQRDPKIIKALQDAAKALAQKLPQLAPSIEVGAERVVTRDLLTDALLRGLREAQAAAAAAYPVLKNALADLTDRIAAIPEPFSIGLAARPGDVVPAGAPSAAAVALAEQGLPDTITVLVEVMLNLPGNNSDKPGFPAACDAAFAALERTTSTALARAALAPIKKTHGGDFTLLLPYSCRLQGHPVWQALVELTAKAQANEPVCGEARNVGLRGFPTNADLATLQGAAAASKAAHPHLAGAIDALVVRIIGGAEEQLFGPQRHLSVIAYHGFADPIRDVVKRAP